MSIIIVGAGVVGLQVANRLLEEGKDVTIIEQSEAVVRYSSSRLDCMVIHGPGNNLDILRKAGAETADYFIALTGSDEINMICCTMVAAEFKISNKMARVRNVEYMETQIAEQGYWGIDYMINPENEAAKSIMQQFDAGASNYAIVFENLDIQIQRFLIKADFPLVQKSIHEVAKMLPIPFIIPAIHRDADLIIPDGSTILLNNDEIYIAAKEDNFKKVHQYLGGELPPLKTILLVGGGSIGRLVIDRLLKHKPEEENFFRRIANFAQRNHNLVIKVVERDIEKCEHLSAKYPHILCINADISEDEIFEEENLSSCDLLITATEKPELNIVTSLYARTIGINRTITLVRTENYTRIANELGLHVTVSLKNTVVNSIIRYLLKGNITSIQSAAHGGIDFLELRVESGSQIIGKRLKDIQLPMESVILYVKRHKETFIPDGNSIIQDDDHIIILTRKKNVPRIEALASSEAVE